MMIKKIKFEKPDENKINCFKKHAKLINDLEPLVDILLFSARNADTNEVQDGFIYVESDPYFDESDFHCDKCMKELLIFNFAADKDFPYRSLSMSLGKKKYEMIKNGEIKSEQIDNIHIWFSLLND